MISLLTSTVSKTTSTLIYATWVPKPTKNISTSVTINTRTEKAVRINSKQARRNKSPFSIFTVRRYKPISINTMANVLMTMGQNRTPIRSMSISMRVAEVMAMIMATMGTTTEKVTNMTRKTEEVQALGCKLPYCMHYVSFVLLSRHDYERWPNRLIFDHLFSRQPWQGLCR